MKYNKMVKMEIIKSENGKKRHLPKVKMESRKI